MLETPIFPGRTLSVFKTALLDVHALKQAYLSLTRPSCMLTLACLCVIKDRESSVRHRGVPANVVYKLVYEPRKIEKAAFTTVQVL